jgi:hypothetical protein
MDLATSHFFAEAAQAPEGRRLESRKVSFSTVRTQTYESFERAARADGAIAATSPLVRWAAAEFGPTLSEEPSALQSKTPA